MTTNTQDQIAKPAAVELRDDALDQAAGGVITANAGGGPRVAAGDVTGNGQAELVDRAIAKPRT